MSLQVVCPYCVPSRVFLTATLPSDVSGTEWRRQWKTIVLRQVCADCGAEVVVADDGIPVESGGSIQSTNVSRPRIDSVSLGSGIRAGGQSLDIHGSALDSGNLVVRFGGKPATAVSNRTATSVRVTTPPARYTLRISNSLYRLTLSELSGQINLNSQISFNGGVYAVVRLVQSPTVYWVRFTNAVGNVAVLTNQYVSGVGFSGRAANVVGLSFMNGEGVVGLTSGARGSLTLPNKVDSPTDSFTSNEIVAGESSGAHAELDSPAYSGTLSISVENEHGQRLAGGILENVFTYL